MDFVISRPDVVRSPTQRWLLKFWIRHCDGSPVPRWQTVDPKELSRASDHLGLLDVRPGDQGPRFFVRYSGAAINTANGFDSRGQHLDEVIHPQHREQGLGSYRLAVTSGRPAYTIQEFLDRNERKVEFERLVLPFGADGQTVDRLLTSLEFFCADGAFDQVSLRDSHSPKLLLAARIEAHQ